MLFDLFLKIPVVYIKDETELREARSPIFSRSNLFIKQYENVVGTAKSIFEETKRTGNVPVEETNEMVQSDLLPLSRRSGTIDYLNEINHLASDIYNHRVQVHGRREKDGQKALHHQLIELQFRFTQAAVDRKSVV